MAAPQLASWDPLKEVPDLSGRVVFITGGSTGIGLATAKVAALRGARVYVGTRHEAKTQAALAQLRAENPSIPEGQIKRIPLDLLDLTSIVEAAATLSKLETKVDILFNLATMNRNGPESRTADGWENIIAGDYAGHFLLTNLLLPLLKTAARAPGADVRIVHFASQAPMHFLPASYVANFTSPDVLVNPVPYYPWTWRWMNAYMFVGDMVSYAVAKVALTSFAAELQRRLDAEGVPILSIAINPGNVDTEQSASCIPPMLQGLVMKTFISVDEGVKHGLYTATSPALREGGFGGKFLMPLGQVTQLHPLVDNEKEVTALWKNTEVAINELLAKKGLQPLLAW